MGFVSWMVDFADSTLDAAAQSSFAALAGAMGGIVVVESVFGWPGIGQLAWQAIQRVDIPIIMGVTIVSAVAIVLGNLLADLVAPLIDPRIRLR